MAERLPRAAPIDAAPFAFLALIGGAMAMGISPVFVRFAEVGPFTSAFWRVALALPALWLWARLEQRPAGDVRPDASARISVLLAGLLFAGDLTFWHLAIMNTSVANATFLATLAPVWVVLGSGLILGEHVERKVFFGLALCLAGAAALIGGTWSLSPAQIDGDLYGVATSFFFGAYFLAVRRARRAYGSGRTLFLSSLVTALVLLAEAVLIEDQTWPPHACRNGRAPRFGPCQPRRRPGTSRLRARPPACRVFRAGHLPGGDRRGVLRLAHPRRAHRRDAGARRSSDLRRHRRRAATAVEMNPRELCRAIFDAAVERSLPSVCLPQHLPVPPRGRLIVLACGKCGAHMAEACERHYLDGGLLDPERLVGICVTRHGYGRPLRRIRCVEAGHPVPDRAGLEATAEVLALASEAGPDDLALVLVSGGGSANWIAPANGLTIEDKQALTKALLASGAPISDINTIRKHLSRIKGGRLAARLYPAPSLTLCISDVPGDDPSLIASGPTVPDPTSAADALALLQRWRIDMPAACRGRARRAGWRNAKAGRSALRAAELRIVARPADSIEAAAATARAAGWDVEVLGDALEGEASEIGAAHGRMAVENARNGRRVALPFRGRAHRHPARQRAAADQTRNTRWRWRSRSTEPAKSPLLPPTRTAPMAAADRRATPPALSPTPPRSPARRGKGLNAANFLKNNDTTRFFESLGDLLITGPTGTNVNDLRCVLVDKGNFDGQ